MDGCPIHDWKLAADSRLECCETPKGIYWSHALTKVGFFGYDLTKEIV
jgi:hypothetical protein